jgi:hypothetical protein
MIGPKTIASMKQAAAEKIDIYAVQIDKAFLKADDGKLKISIGFDISMSEKTANGVEVATTIGFVADKIKDKTICTVVENQTDLPLADKVYKIKGD